MYVYSQSTGELTQDGIVVGVGYAGAGSGKNDSEMQAVPNVGPLPQGFYTIGEPYTDPIDGPLCFPLTPDPTNQMFGRSGFRLHADSIRFPGSASKGCIVMAHPIRQQIADDTDRRLEVTA
jgi:hypothetical protein